MTFPKKDDRSASVGGDSAPRREKSPIGGEELTLRDCVIRVSGASYVGWHSLTLILTSFCYWWGVLQQRTRPPAHPQTHKSDCEPSLETVSDFLTGLVTIPITCQGDRAAKVHTISKLIVTSLLQLEWIPNTTRAHPHHQKGQEKRRGSASHLEESLLMLKTSALPSMSSTKASHPLYLRTTDLGTALHHIPDKAVGHRRLGLAPVLAPTKMQQNLRPRLPASQGLP